MPDYKIGQEGGLYVVEAGDADTLATYSADNELKTVDEVTVTMSSDQASFSDRSSRAERNRKTSKNIEITGTVNVDAASNDAFEALRDAYLEGSIVTMAALSNKLETGSEGAEGNFTVTGFNISQPLQDVVTVEFTAQHYHGGNWETK